MAGEKSDFDISSMEQGNSWRLSWCVCKVPSWGSGCISTGGSSANKLHHVAGCWELTMFKGCMFAIITLISLSSSGVSSLFISVGGKLCRSEGGGRENISLCPFHFFLMHPFLNILYILCIYQKLQYFIDWYLSLKWLPHWYSVRTNLRFGFLWMGWRSKYVPIPIRNANTYCLKLPVYD